MTNEPARRPPQGFADGRTAATPRTLDAFAPGGPIAPGWFLHSHRRAEVLPLDFLDLPESVAAEPRGGVRTPSLASTAVTLHPSPGTYKGPPAFDGSRARGRRGRARRPRTTSSAGPTSSLSCTFWSTGSACVPTRRTTGWSGSYPRRSGADASGIDSAAILSPGWPRPSRRPVVRGYCPSLLMPSFSCASSAAGRAGTFSSSPDRMICS